MHSLKSEIETLHAAGVIDRESTDQQLAIDSGEVFSLFYQLQFTLYLAVLMIVTGVGIVLKNNLDRIGPVAIALSLGLVAASCYAYVIRQHLRKQVRSIVGDYILLLGALLMSADVGFIEVQFHLLGEHWSLHLLLLAAIHAVTAYALDSRLVLSVALASLAGWFGASRNIDDILFHHHDELAYANRSILCAIAVFGWRMFNSRINTRPQFNEVLEHYAINLGFWAGLIWCGVDSNVLLGILMVAALATATIRIGLHRPSEWFIVYGVIYAAIGACIVVANLINDPLMVSFTILIAIIAVATLLWRLHNQLRERST